MIKIKKLGKEDIDKVIKLSLKIFKPKKKQKHHNPEVWKKYLDNGGILLGAFVKNKLVGYKFGYRVNKNKFHTWLEGVAEQYGNRGIATKLMKVQEKMLRDLGYKIVTINTYREKFPVMYSFLKKHDYKIYKEEEKDWKGKKVIKSFFRKNL